MTSPLLIHVGYHKTATTWMQKVLFTPEYGYRALASHAEVFRHVVQPHGLDFDPTAMRDLLVQRSARVDDAQVDGALGDGALGDADKVRVVSSEILSGNPIFGGRESEVYAERLAQIAPDARILISIRNQMKILPSVYMQYLLRGGTLSWPAFFAGTNEPGYFGFSARHFEYDRLVQRYQTLFGAENVYVMPQEALRRDMQAAALDLARFAENKVFSGLSEAALKVRAASYPEYAAPVLRRVNHLRKSTLNARPVLHLGSNAYRAAGYVLRRAPFKTLLKGKTPVSNYVRSQYAGRFAQSNARLAELVRTPLDLTGYET